MPNAQNDASIVFETCYDAGLIDREGKNILVKHLHEQIKLKKSVVTQARKEIETSDDADRIAALRVEISALSISIQSDMGEIEALNQGAKDFTSIVESYERNILERERQARVKSRSDSVKCAVA